ncbi:MAG: NAD(P)-dependent oxidoreductase [Treponema sp.]|nr:NAD(P)-dependent oxidoreductase [Treponema sp.]
MNVVVSGASGYLGCKLVESFLSRGNRVLAVARNTRGRLRTLAKDCPALELCELDVDDLLFSMSRFSPDVVLSTTCCYETDPKFLTKTVSSNYIFPTTLLKSTLQLEKKIRFVSTGTSLPASLNLYSLTKKQFSELGKFFSGLGKVQFVNVLLESFYGADEPNDRFIKRSIRSLLRHQELAVTEGTQQRDYVAVGDVVSALNFLSVSDRLTESYYEIPLGSGESPSIREILEFLREETHSQSFIHFGAVSPRPNEPSTRADLTALRQLGYTGKMTSWKDGMKKMIGEMQNEDTC